MGLAFLSSARRFPLAVRPGLPAPGFPSRTSYAQLRTLGVLRAPTRDEGFALVLLEAAALGKSIIATNACRVAELIEDRATRRIVPPDSPGTLGDAMIEVFADMRNSPGMGERLRPAGQSLHPRRAKSLA